jgi:hypothetical protein
MTCEVHGIYLKFGSFNGIDPIVPTIKGLDLLKSSPYLLMKLSVINELLV